MTELLYLNDTYLTKTESVVIAVYETVDGVSIILNRTNFYPQGGGQPSDSGSIIGEQGTVEITKVRLTQDGTVLHEGTITQGEIQAGDTVQLIIDEKKRLQHARLHSGGHLIDIAVEQLKIPGLKATKGYHYADGSYVEYRGELDDPLQYIEPLQRNIDLLINHPVKIFAVELSSQEARARNIFAPPGKSARFVYFDGYEKIGCGCGGTHLRTTAEIEKLVVRKVTCKKGVVRVSYE